MTFAPCDMRTFGAKNDARGRAVDIVFKYIGNKLLEILRMRIGIRIEIGIGIGIIAHIGLDQCVEQGGMGNKNLEESL
jgi:hypothetical protein